MKKIVLLSATVSVLLLSGCRREAETASYNLSKDADEFRIMRRVTFINTIQGEPIYSVEGNCSVSLNEVKRVLNLTCKQGDNKYAKHMLGLSDNSTFVVEQLEFNEQDPYRLKFVFKPKQVFSLPNWEVK